jgi:hypothetical protein
LEVPEQVWLACPGELLHTHTGANKNKLEHYIRQFLKPRERPPQEIFPLSAMPGGGYR